MQSWNLDSFIEIYGIHTLVAMWGVSRQTVHACRGGKRDIRIIKVDGFYEIIESKLLKKIPSDEMDLVPLGITYQSKAQ